MGARSGESRSRCGGGPLSALGLLPVLSLLAAGCAGTVAGVPADADDSAPTSSPSASPSPSRASYDGRLIGAATVLDDGSGPELCLGAVATSYPPQCGGPPLVGWTWPKGGVERAAGVTWGSFFVVGRYDGRRFRVERVVDEATARPSLPVRPDADLSSPCPEPAGGWRAPDPERSTREDQAETFQAAAELPGYAGSWIDDRGDPAQDPLTTVVNVRVTGDVDEAERTLREVWGGPLCVSSAQRTEADLRRVVEQLSRPDLLSAGPGRDVVELQVIYDDGRLQRELDDRHGEGVVQVDSALRPFLG